MLLIEYLNQGSSLTASYLWSYASKATNPWLLCHESIASIYLLSQPPDQYLSPYCFPPSIYWSYSFLFFLSLSLSLSFSIFLSWASEVSKNRRLKVSTFRFNRFWLLLCKEVRLPSTYLQTYRWFQTREGFFLLNPTHYYSWIQNSKEGLNQENFKSQNLKRERKPLLSYSLTHSLTHVCLQYSQK